MTPFYASPLPLPARARQRGQGALEFLLAAGPVLLLGLGSLEAIHWYFARQAASLALSQAGRAAITQHADPAALDLAFRQAILPLYAAPTAQASRSRLNTAMQKREQDTGLPAWRIYIISPSAASFTDYSSNRPDLPQQGHAVIDNDYLQEQHQARLAQGWPQGRGQASGQTTLEANTLVMQLTWLHQPLLPGVRQLIKLLAPPDTRYGSLAMARAGYLPIHRQISMVMQSHPMELPAPAHGRVLRLGGPPSSPSDTRHQDSAAYPVSASGPGGASVTPYPGGAPTASGNGSTQPPAWPGNGTGQYNAVHTQDCTGLWCPGSLNYWGSEPDAGAAGVLDDCPGCCD